MNGTGLAFISFLIIVLIAVSLGMQQIQAQQAAELARVENQRNLSVELATAAVKQRDIAYRARDEAVARREDLQKEILVKEAELEKKVQELEDAQTTISDLNNRLVVLQANNTVLQDQVTRQSKGTIPSTGNLPVVLKKQEMDNTGTICLAFQTSCFPGQLGISLVVLIGIVALGGGGYMVYHHDPNRKYTIQMSREQLKAFARYQRGNSPKVT